MIPEHAGRHLFNTSRELNFMVDIAPTGTPPQINEFALVATARVNTATKTVYCKIGYGTPDLPEQSKIPRSIQKLGLELTIKSLTKALEELS